MVLRRARTAIATLALVLACGDDENEGASTPATGTAANPQLAAPAGLAAGDVGALLDALRQSHAHVREAIGPHRLHVHATFDLAPQGEPATPEPAVDELRPQAQHVDDNLELVWLTTAVNQPRFSLSQLNDHDRGRDVVVDSDRIYTRQRNRSWYVGPLQADVYELWLDDAQRSVYDVVALAAPQLAISVAETDGGFASGRALRYTLSRATTVDPRRAPSDPRSEWRKTATIDNIEGSLVLDTRSGAWTLADVRVAFSMPGPDGRTLAGRVSVTAEATAMDPSAPLAVPSDAQPLLERTRYDAERARLLDGLAGR